LATGSAETDLKLNDPPDALAVVGGGENKGRKGNGEGAGRS